MTSELKERTAPATAVGTGTLEKLPVETATEPLRPDHVRSHSMRCYWDFVECRWRCSQD